MLIPTRVSHSLVAQKSIVLEKKMDDICMSGLEILTHSCSC